MMDDEQIDTIPRTYSGALLAAIAVALVGRAGRSDLELHAQQPLSSQQTELADAKQQNVKLEARAARDRRAAEGGHRGAGQLAGA